MFFTYSQNNSGGSFVFSADRGISTYVIVEADDAEHADYRAKRIGLYFDGCDDGRDCDCCGDRWHAAYGQGDKVPSIYSEPVQDADHPFKWQGSNPEAFVHFADGGVQAYGFKLNELK